MNRVMSSVLSAHYPAGLAPPLFAAAHGRYRGRTTDAKCPPVELRLDPIRKIDQPTKILCGRSADRRNAPGLDTLNVRLASSKSRKLLDGIEQLSIAR